MDQATLKQWMSEAKLEGKEDADGFLTVVSGNLEISVGYDVLKGKDDTMAACLVRADEKLYQDKRLSGRGR